MKHTIPVHRIFVMTRFGRMAALFLAAATLTLFGLLILPNPAAAESVQPGAVQALERPVNGQIAAGGAFTCLLDAQGAVHCWGDIASAPDGVLFTQISAGETFVCGVTVQGAAVCWDADAAALPVPEPTPANPFDQISAGGSQACGVRQDGTISCWKPNGDPAESPAATAGIPFTQVSVGAGHACALRRDGSITCWGDNTDGEAETPDPVNPFVQVSAGKDVSCAVKSSGGIFCWGSTENALNRVPTLGLPYQQVSVGNGHACAVSASGNLVCWGLNDQGQSDEPLVNWNFTQASAGWGAQSCGLHADGTFTCWGSRTDETSPRLSLSSTLPPHLMVGQTVTSALSAVDEQGWSGALTYSVASGALPDGLTLDPARGVISGAPQKSGVYAFTLQARDETLAAGELALVVHVADVNPPAVGQLSLGDSYSCLLSPEGKVSCWGYSSSNVVEAFDGNENLLQISAGYEHGCGIYNDGSLVCLGSNDAGESSAPAAQPDDPFVQISAGNAFSCAVQQSGAVQCWGESGYHQTTVPTPNTRFVQVSAGGMHACGLKQDGSIVCWGANGYGQTQPPALNSGFVKVQAGGMYSCALRANGSIACWGQTDNDQLSVPAPNQDYVDLNLTGGHTCAVRSNGAAVCWGAGWSGENDIPAPNQAFQAVAAGVYNHSCGLKTDGSVVCWGSNSGNQAPSLTITLPSLPDSQVDAAYPETWIALNPSAGIKLPLRYWVSGQLPDGLHVDAGTGYLSGTPTQAGTFTFSVQARDAHQIAANQTYTIQVDPAATILQPGDAQTVTYGETATLTAQVSGSHPRGPVTFQENGADVPGCEDLTLDSQQKAVCQTNRLSVGAHAITVAYAGDANYGPSATTFTVQVDPAQPAFQLTAASNPVRYDGQPVTVTLRATAGNPTGTVAFLENGSALTGCAAVSLASGSATCPVSGLNAGSHQLTAQYSGDGNYLGAEATMTLVVQKVPTQLSVSGPGVATFGTPVTLHASVTGSTDAGTVSFEENGVSLPGCQNLALKQGQASCAWAKPSVGYHPVHVVYMGDANHALSTGDVSFTVLEYSVFSALGSSQNPAPFGENVTIFAQFSGDPFTGTVTFQENGETLPGCAQVAIQNNRAECTLVRPSIGEHILTAVYSGDSAHEPSSLGSLQQVILGTRVFLPFVLKTP
jgi:alpha-tubulin suppressor-like RCC1 family protein